MRVFKTSYTGSDGRQRQAAKWYVEFRDHLSTVRRVPGFTDRRASDELGRQLDRLVTFRATAQPLDVELSRWIEAMPAKLQRKLVGIGLLAGQRAAATKPLIQHLEGLANAEGKILEPGFLQHLKNKGNKRKKGNTAKHVADTVRRVKQVIEGCGFVFWSDLDTDKIMQYLADLREGTKDRRDISIASSNKYLGAVKYFARWMVDDERAIKLPKGLAKAQSLNAQTDRRHKRRPLEADELRRLIGAAESSGEREGMSGHARAILYRLAAESGLRAGELRSLTRASFSLEGDSPSVTIDAASAKNGKTKPLPLLPATATALSGFVANKMPAAAAFTMPDAWKLADMLRADLAEARKAWIAEAQIEQERRSRLDASFLSPVDDSGRIIDFHALRHTFISNLAAGGVHPKTAMELARHSSITLTMDLYTHTYRGDVRAALDALPDLDAPASQSLRATGTTDAAAADKNSASFLSLQGGLNRTDLDDSGQVAGQNESAPSFSNTEKTAIFPENSSPDGGSRTRTGFAPQRILSPMGKAQRTHASIVDSMLCDDSPAGNDQNSADYLALSEIAEAWPSLPADVRERVLLIVRSAALCLSRWEGEGGR